MGKVALVCGVTGQDGAYLAYLLLSKGYKVIGTSRDAQSNTFSNLEKLGIKSKVILASMALNDFRSVLQTITKYEPVEIYNLAGQTSVGLSFSQPVETMESICSGVLNLLEAIRFINKKIHLYNAGSGEVFGNTLDAPANEQTAFKPRSPYAVAKAAGYWQVVNYREAYDLFACTGLLFNHESPLRPKHFVTQKIIHAAREIAAGRLNKITLGNLNVVRDWGWAPDYVNAMWMMLQKSTPDDYIIATGHSCSLKDYVQKVFQQRNLEWEKYVEVDNSFYRLLDIEISMADVTKANTHLGWKADVSIEEAIQKMSSEILF